MKVDSLTKQQRLQVLDYMKSLKNQPQTQGEVEDFASPSSPAHPVGVSASPFASPVASPTVDIDQESTTVLDINFSIPQNAKVNEGNKIDNNSSQSITKYDPLRKLEWAKLKDDRIINVEEQNGLCFSGRQSGMANSAKSR